MRTNIEIDDRLMAEAMAASGLSTKRETVEAGLRLLARRKRQTAARDLFGRVEWEGDLDADRLDDPAGLSAR
jgi:Arc/MetJ family transcription regulator